MAARLGHDHIQQHQINLLRIRLVNFHGVQSVFGQKNRIAQLLQRFNQKIPDRFVIIHDQDGFRTGRKGFYGIAHFKIFSSSLAFFTCLVYIILDFRTDGKRLNHFPGEFS